MTLEEFKESFIALELNFDKIQSFERTEFFWRRLRSNPAPNFEVAVNLIMKHEKCFPVLATFLEYLEAARPLVLDEEFRLIFHFQSVLSVAVNNMSIDKEKFITHMQDIISQSGCKLVNPSLLDAIWAKIEACRNKGVIYYDEWIESIQNTTAGYSGRTGNSGQPPAGQ